MNTAPDAAYARLVARVTRVRPSQFVVQVRGATLPRPHTTLSAARAAAFLRADDHGRGFCQALLDGMRQRHSQHGQTVYLLEPDVKAGVDAWSRGDYEAAVKEWREPALRKGGRSRHRQRQDPRLLRPAGCTARYRPSAIRARAAFPAR